MALLAATVLFAGGVLFVKYKLEGLRAVVQEAAESRMGARLRAGAVVVNGLRGLRVDDVDIAIDSAAGPAIQFNAGAAYIYIDLIDLLYGEVTIHRIQADNAVIRIQRPPDRPWIAPDAEGRAGTRGWLDAPSFRIVGKQCGFEVLNLMGGTRLALSDFEFDVARLAGSPDIVAKLSGKLAPGSAKDVNVDLRFTSMEDFDLRVHCAELSTADIPPFVPSAERFIKSGVAAPSLRVAGYPGKTLVVAFEVPFEQLAIRDQPDFIRPLQGTLTGVANYDIVRHVFSLTTARIESEQLAGRVEGSIALDETAPKLDLRLDATRLPVAEALSYVLQGRADAYGDYDLELQEPYQIVATLQGTLDSPAVAFRGSAGAGQFAFRPSDTARPAATLQLGPVALSWDSASSTPAGSLTVTDGVLTHEPSGLKAEKVSGVLKVQERRLTMDPLNAEITGNPFVGSLHYDVDADRLDVAANGTLSNIEHSKLSGLSKNIDVKGALNLRARVVKTGAQWTVDADVDATQAEIGGQWWFLKPQGVGADAKKLHVEAVANRSASITAETSIASSHGKLSAQFEYTKKGYRCQSADVQWDKLDVDALGRCLCIPYKVTGGAAVDGKLEWRRESKNSDQWRMTMTGAVDQVSLLPENGDRPMACEGLRVEVAVTGDANPTGCVTLKAKKGRMPAIRQKWFVPLQTGSAAQARSWTFDLAADLLESPPWKGSGFAATAFLNASESGFDAFRADVAGGGRIEGVYRDNKQDNAYALNFAWKDIPATYLIDQFDYPHILTGTTTGAVGYSLDRDDPGTLKGQGSFEIHDGQFSADFILDHIQGHLENKISALPTSLRFSSLRSDVVFAGDRVTTSNLQLASEGIKVSGEGSFVVGGDMDYDLKVALAPTIAEKIPALRDNFNVQGLRLAQQDVELAFRVKGSTVNPRGELAEMPPIGITLVSSALEVTSDAFRVIDIPRKILGDLLKIGGGLVGITR